MKEKGKTKGRHVHADLYIEAVNDLSIVWEIEQDDGKWVSLGPWQFGVVFWVDSKYRIKGEV